MQTLRLFSDVARCRSFSQAAKLHSITQSAASQRIHHLEKHLGVSLFDRSVRPLALSEAGRLFLQGVGEVLHRYDRLESRVKASGQDPSGVVRVSAIYSSGIDLLSRVREHFEAKHPKVAVQISYDNPDDVHEAVVAGRADVGILSYPDRFKKVGVIPLRDETMAVVCPPTHALASLGSVTPEQLTGYEMVAFESSLPVGRRIANYLKEHRAAPVTTHCFDNLDTIKSAVAATDRFAILPTRTTRREVEAGSLVVVELNPHLARPMGLIYRRSAKQDSPLSPSATLFIDFLLEHAGQNEDATLTTSSAAVGAASRASDRSNPAPPRRSQLVGAKR